MIKIFIQLQLNKTGEYLGALFLTDTTITFSNITHKTNPSKKGDKLLSESKFVPHEILQAK